MTAPKTCECGCGQTVTPGNRFVYLHHTRVRPITAPGYVRCPTCSQSVKYRKDGQPGLHFQKNGRNRVRCPAGLIGTRPAPNGIRVRVTVDAVIPVAWSRGEFRQNLRVALQTCAAEAFLVDVVTSPELGEAS